MHRPNKRAGKDRIWPCFLQACSTCQSRYDDHRVSRVL